MTLELERARPQANTNHKGKQRKSDVRLYQNVKLLIQNQKSLEAEIKEKPQSRRRYL